jgi:serine phosphatase RsbU (regulator of sigma subunit)
LETDDKTRTATTTVVIVDDEEIVTQSLGSFLEFETEYRVQTFQSPHEALTFIKQRSVDLVISDFLMPQMNGLQFLAEVRKLYPHVPRIILTGYADKENAIRAINEIGLYQYLEKPWDNDHLKLVVRNAVTNKGLQDQLREKIGELDRVLRQRDELFKRDDFMRRELEMARCVQEKLLPHRLPTLDGFRCEAVYRPAMEVGGDFYDVVRLADGRTAVLVADITGHGIQAALCMALLKFAFSSFSDSAESASQIVIGMNAILYRGLPAAMFVAALVALIDPVKKQCAVANAGLPYPLLVRRELRQVECVCNAGLLLGVTEENLYGPSEETIVDLDNGDGLIIFTDGVTEAPNDQGEPVGADAVCRQLESFCDQSLPDMLARLADNALACAGDRDDITLFGVEVT